MKILPYFKTSSRQKGAIIFINGFIKALMKIPGYPDSYLTMGEIVNILQQVKEGYE